jgi:hypothetical protein
VLQQQQEEEVQSMPYLAAVEKPAAENLPALLLWAASVYQSVFGVTFANSWLLQTPVGEYRRRLAHIS